MRKSRKKNSNIKIETWINLIINLNIDEFKSRKLKKLVFKNNIRRNQKFEVIRRKFVNSKFLLIPNLP